MKNFIIAFLVGLGSFQSLQAALPPLYQSANEIKAILSNENFGQVLQSGELIQDIARSENGYVITTNKNRVQVNVSYVPSKRVGPAEFKIEFQSPDPIDSQGAVQSK